MKKISKYSLVLLSGLILMLSACKKSIEGRTDNTPALSPADIDLEAGTWKLVSLSRVDSFVVAAPALITLPGYIGELNEIKGLQTNMSADQKNKIKYPAALTLLIIRNSLFQTRLMRQGLMLI